MNLRKSIVFFACLLIFSIGSDSLNAQSISGADHWHGFKQIQFKIDTAAAYIVVPAKPLPGNPWLWRTYSPEFHIEIDSILVTRGFHIGYININNKLLYGQPALMTIWEKFYEYLITDRKLSARPALSGAVRGSLCEFAWAKKHPDRVCCIYSENPVSQIQYWPGAKKGVGASPDQWKQLLAAYGFTDEQGWAFGDNPKDHLEQLAAQKVPLFFSFGLHDGMIPMEDNALQIAQEYIKQGGPVMLWPMTIGKQEQNGHHVTIEQPENIADFIIRASHTGNK